MFRGKSDQVELGMVGLLAGAFWGSVLLKAGLLGALAGAIAGTVVFGGLIGSFVSKHEERIRSQYKFAVAGLFIGWLIGSNQLLKIGLTGAIAGAAVGVLVFGMLAGGFINGQKEKGRYVSFQGETLLVFLLGFLGAWGGIWVASLLAGNVFPGREWVSVAGGVLLPLAGSLILSLSLGFVVSINRFRPLLGGILTLLGGGIVLWVGISIAPMLFLPGSGLYWAGMVIGTLICTLAIIAVAYPPMHITIGAVIVVLSVLSFVGAAGGFIIGGIMGLLGGALIVAWEALPAFSKGECVAGNESDSPA